MSIVQLSSVFILSHFGTCIRDQVTLVTALYFLSFPWGLINSDIYSKGLEID